MEGQIINVIKVLFFLDISSKDKQKKSSIL